MAPVGTSTIQSSQGKVWYGLIKTIELYVFLEKFNGGICGSSPVCQPISVSPPLVPLPYQQFLLFVLGLLSKELNYCFY